MPSWEAKAGEHGSYKKAAEGRIWVLLQAAAKRRSELHFWQHQPQMPNHESGKVHDLCKGIKHRSLQRQNIFWGKNIKKSNNKCFQEGSWGGKINWLPDLSEHPPISQKNRSHHLWKARARWRGIKRKEQTYAKIEVLKFTLQYQRSSRKRAFAVWQSFHP